MYTLYGDSVSCDIATPTDAIYRTNLTGIHPFSTTQLVDLISQWIMGGATITSGITQITLHSQCPVAIETANEPLCRADSTTIGNKPDNGEGGEVILVSVLLAVVVLSCALLIVLCVYVLIWRTQRIQTWRYIHVHGGICTCTKRYMYIEVYIHVRGGICTCTLRYMYMEV